MIIWDNPSDIFKYKNEEGICNIIPTSHVFYDITKTYHM